MAMVSIYHDTASIGYACASTISTMRYALMGHCVQLQGVALHRPNAAPWPWHALPMRIPYTYEQGSCNLTYTYTRL